MAKAGAVKEAGKAVERAAEMEVEAEGGGEGGGEGGVVEMVVGGEEAAMAVEKAAAAMEAVMAVEKVPAIGRRVTVPLGAALLVAGALTAVAAVATPAEAPAHQHTHPTLLPHTGPLAAHDGEDIHGTLVDRG